MQFYILKKHFLGSVIFTDLYVFTDLLINIGERDSSKSPFAVAEATEFISNGVISHCRKKSSATFQSKPRVISVKKPLKLHTNLVKGVKTQHVEVKHSHGGNYVVSTEEFYHMYCRRSGL